MVKILFDKYQQNYLYDIVELVSIPQVKDALGLNNNQISVEFVSEMINYKIEQENLGQQYSRVLLNEDKELIGSTTIKNRKTMAYIDTWIGFPYWREDYYQLAIAETLYIAFLEFDLKYVFTFARLSDKRSIEDQKKIPYFRIGVEKEFPKEHKKIESWIKVPCTLNMIEKSTFLEWYLKNS